ncbi:Tat pathway signal protein [Roseomonas sp. CECT 9278]|uniref:Tat pathway signal protein n=1 Tax=Roseomonas sp. CECT 9278 TaxID=2845823 RepID=UPI001E34F715|nr:Tat pathway signal protein [Roseomonas sp. CECT 9278]CAH0299290.1 hypothetical protein ROS9278_04492 [Roseomonas sp. CECT 9278]
MRNPILPRLMLSGLAALMAPAAAAHAESPLPVELNRLEQVASPAEACRVWMVVSNDAAGAPALGSLRLDLVAFARDGQIARRVAVELGPVGAGRTAVRIFDLPGLACESLSRLLVNDVLACRIGGQDAADCADRLRATSRTGLRFGL